MYFTKFPAYQTKIGSKSIVIEDIFTRIITGKTYSEISSALLPYLVKDGEKIEDVAYTYYGTPTYHWVIILINNITDPRTQWPLTETGVLEKIYDVYDYTVTVSNTSNFFINDIITSNVNGKFLITNKTDTTLNLRYQSGSVYLTVNTLLKKVNPAVSTTIISVIDPTENIHHYEEVLTGYEVFYDSSIVNSISELSSVTSLQNRIGLGEVIPVTNIEYEKKINDEKRSIKVLNKKYLQQFVKTFDSEVSL